MIGVKSTGDFTKTKKFLDKMLRREIYSSLEQYGKQGVDALASNTPRRSGKTASSWGYKIVRTKGRISIQWLNNHVNDGVNIAVLIQYGHATGNGGFVQGIDYINPAIRPIFEKIAEDVWRQVKA
jgi:Bacteriophage HK97-gp10, putative tail-component